MYGYGHAGMGRGAFGAFRWQTDESNDFVPYSHHPYAYALSNPVHWTDPTGKCVPWLDPTCRPVWELGQGANLRDGAEYLMGLKEGFASPVVGLYQLTQRETWQVAGRGLQAALKDPTDSAAYVRQQIADPVVRAVLNPAQTLQRLNQDPRAFGRVLATTAATLALTSATTKLTTRVSPVVQNTIEKAFPGPRISPHTFDDTLAAGEGLTSMYGTIKISPHGTALDRMRALSHEQVHSFLTPRGIGQIRRAQFSQWVYNNSHLFRYIEEAAAESVAQVRTGGSLRTGLLFPITAGYVQPVRVAAEGVIFCGSVGVIVNEGAKAIP